MVTANVSYPDFSSGELSPNMYGRFDLAAFFNGGRRVENFITQVTGPAKFRTGSVYAAKTRGNTAAFLYNFKYSESLAFILEFTDQKLRFYRNDGRVQFTAQAITAITKANPAVVTYSGSDTYANGDPVYLSNIVGMTQLNGNDYVVANVDTTANTFELSGVNSTGYTTYVSGGTIEEIVEITTPFAAADLFKLKFSPVLNGIMYIAHPSYNPQTLTFTSATSWAMANHSPSGLTLSAGNYPGAVGSYEQRLVYGGSNNKRSTIYLSKSGDNGDFTVGTAVIDGIAYTISGAGKITWIEGTSSFLAIGDGQDIFQATGGIDAVITPASISIKPTKSFGVADIMPIGRGSQIIYMQNNYKILRSFEYDLQSNAYKPIDRNTIADHITSSGIKQIAYQEGRPNVIWAVKNNGVLTGMTIEDQESVTGWHRHTTDGDIISIASTQRANDYNQLWQCAKRTVNGSTQYYVEFYADPVEFPRREDYISGTDAAAQVLDTLTWENLLFESMKEYIHLDASVSYYGDDLGLSANATLTPAAVTGTGINFTASAAVFDNTMVGRELWRKAIDGTESGRALITAYTSSTVVVCEVLEDFDATAAIPAGEWLLTAGTFTGLKHLEGKLVSVIADGGQNFPATVSGGQITLDNQSSVVHVGLPYTGWLETNDLEGGGTTGTSQTKKKNVNAVGFRFLDTLYAKYGTSYYKLNQIEMRSAAMRMDRPPVLFTGDTKERYTNESSDERDGGWSRSKRVVVCQDQPFPCNLQLIVPYMSVSN